METLLSQTISKLGQWARAQKPSRLLALGLFLFLLKTGFRGILPWASFEPIERFPKLYEGFSSYSLGLLALSNLTHANTEIKFFLLNVFLLGTFLTICLLLISRRFSKSNYGVLFFLLCLYSPVGVVLFGNIGRHDLLTVAGFTFFFLAINFKFRFFFLALGVLGSPEHFITGWLFAFFTSVILKDNKWIKRTREALAVSIALSLPIFAFVYLQTQSDDRITNILTEHAYMKIALKNAAQSIPLELYSYFGTMIPIFVITFAFYAKYDKIVLTKLFLIFAFPFLINLIIVDKTRDYVIAMLASCIVLFSSLLRNDEFLAFTGFFSKSRDILIGSLVITSIALPSIEVTFEGTPRSPHAWAIEKVGEYCFNHNVIC